MPVTYDLQIASDQNFASVVLQKNGLADSQYTLTANETLAADFNNAPCFWRVQAIDGAGNISAWSDSMGLLCQRAPEPGFTLARRRYAGGAAHAL